MTAPGGQGHIWWPGQRNPILGNYNYGCGYYSSELHKPNGHITRGTTSLVFRKDCIKAAFPSLQAGSCGGHYHAFVRGITEFRIYLTCTVLLAANTSRTLPLPFSGWTLLRVASFSGAISASAHKARGPQRGSVFMSSRGEGPGFTGSLIRLYSLQMMGWNNIGSRGCFQRLFRQKRTYKPHETKDAN